MRNISRNLLIGIAYIAVLMFGLLAQSAQAGALPGNVNTLQMATGHMPCHQSTDACFVNGSKCLFVGRTGSDICITQAWMPRSEAPYPTNPEPIAVASRPEIAPVFQTIPSASPVALTIRHSRRNSSLSILFCSFQI
jgi:hypothetical protein